MTWPSVTREKLHGFNVKHKIDFLKTFYRNVKPEGMDEFRLVVLNTSNHSSNSKSIKKILSNERENPVKIA